MEIILVIFDKQGKSILFVLNNLRALRLNEAINRVKNGEIPGVHIVKTKKGSYLRSNPNSSAEDNLNSLSIPLSALTKVKPEEKTAAGRKYYLRRRQYLLEKEKQKEKIIWVDGKRKKTENEVIKYLVNYRTIILSAANDLKVDKYLLGAILIDEDLRRDWLDWFDWFAMLGRIPSVGIAQIKITTAKSLIQRGFYNPNPKDDNLSPQNINKLSKTYFYRYLNSPKHSIYFAAAKINQIITDWSTHINLKNEPAIFGSLYSMDKKPHNNPIANDRGKQIATEFYEICRQALK